MIGLAESLHYEVAPLLLASTAAALMGLSKTALPAASMLAVAMMAAAFPGRAQLSVGVMLPVLLVGNVYAVLRLGRYAQWNRLVSLFPFVVLGMVPAYLLLCWLDGNTLRPVLGALVLAMVALEIARQWFGWSRLPDRWWLVGSVGAVAGFGTMAGNAGGPVMNLFLLSRGLLKEQFIGTCAWFFFLLNLGKVIPFWTRTMVTSETLVFGLALAPAVLGGGLAGTWLLPRISQRSFNILVTLLAGVAGAWLVLG